MKKWLMMPLLVLVALGVMSCGNTLIPSTKGTLSINIGTAMAKTLLPDINMDISTFEISGTGPSGSTFSETVSQAGTVTVTNLLVGQWTVTIDGYNSSAQKIGSATKTASVTPNASTSVSVIIVPLTGNGTFQYTLTWPAEVSLASPSVVGGIYELDADPILVTFELDGNSATYSTDLPAGYYAFGLGLLDGETTMWSSNPVAFRIVEGATTSGRTDLTGDEIAMYGNLDIDVGVDLQNPIDIALTGSATSITTAQSLTVDATISGTPDMIVWFLDGQWLSECAIFTYDFDRFDPSDILPMFKRFNITTFCAPPTMYRFFIKEDLGKYDFSSLKYATTAGEALNAEVYQQFLKATGLKVMEGFGQTESTMLIGNLVGSTPKPGSMGKASPEYEVVLVDQNDRPVSAGEVGEIAVKARPDEVVGLFRCYHHADDTNCEAWRNGYYHTGDTAWQDEDGYFYYHGRTDDVIKSSGYRIGPFEIESILMELPFVLECATTGTPDPVRGQVVKATVVLTRGTAGTDELKREIQEYVKSNTAPYKYPRIVEFVAALPKTTNGKIRRAVLRGGDSGKEL